MGKWTHPSEKQGIRDDVEPFVALPLSRLPPSRQRKQRACFDCASFLCCILGVKMLTWVPSPQGWHLRHLPMLSLWVRCLHLNYLYESVETPHGNFVVRSSTDPIQVVANVSHEPSGSCLLGPVGTVPLRRHAWKGLPIICTRDSPLTGVALHQRGLDYLSCYWFNKT